MALERSGECLSALQQLQRSKAPLVSTAPLKAQHLQQQHVIAPIHVLYFEVVGRGEHAELVNSNFFFGSILCSDQILQRA